MGARAVAQSGAPAPAEGPSAPCPEYPGRPAEAQTLAILGGTVAEKDTVKIGSIPIDESAPAWFMLMIADGVSLRFWLTTPSGTIYDSPIGVDSSSGFFSGEILGGNGAGCRLAEPEVGTWTAWASGVSVTDSTGLAEYLLIASTEATGITLEGCVVPEDISPGEPMWCRAVLRENGAPLLDATVRALVKLPDGTRRELLLIDDGTPPDQVARDGIYTGELGVPTIPGFYTGLIRAARTGVQGRRDFSRDTPAHSVVVEGDDLPRR